MVGIDRDGRIERGETTRRLLVATATRLFAERGYDATSIEAVLEAAGVSRGALYHHFTGKDALFLACFEAMEQANVARLVAAAEAGTTDPVETLRRGCDLFLDLAADPAVRQITLIDAPAVLGWQQWREADERYGFGLLKGVLQAIADEGRLAGPVDTLAHLLLASLMEAAMVIARAPRPARARDEVGEALRTLVDGIIR